MHEPFDPYHKWLGIPAKDQPPNHYRLLGIELFESDAEVISFAADQRMALVRSLQAGRHSALSQKILNELATARVCLLNLETKAEYDRWLQEQLMVQAPQRGPVAAPGLDAPIPPSPPLAVAAPAVGAPPPLPSPTPPLASPTAASVPPLAVDAASAADVSVPVLEVQRDFARHRSLRRQQSSQIMAALAILAAAGLMCVAIWVIVQHILNQRQQSPPARSGGAVQTEPILKRDSGRSVPGKPGR